MNKIKKQKLVKQNKRNQIVNKKYKSTIKTLTKLFLIKKANLNNSDEKYTELFQIKNNLYSLIDKAIKKKVIKKRTGSRKKSFIGKQIINI